MSLENLESDDVLSYDLNHNDPILACPPKARGPTSVHKVHYWSNERVLLWLKKHCRTYHHLYGKLFQEHDITGRVLFQLTDYKLFLMGIEQSVHREEILLQIMKLRLQYYTCELQDLVKCKSSTDEEDL